MKKNKIAIILPTLRKGGLERVATILANNFIDKSSVVLITLVDNTQEYNIDNSIEVIHLNTKQTFNRGLLVLKLYRTLRLCKPDSVLSFSEVFNPISILASRLCGINVYVSDRSSPYKKFSKRDNILKKILYPLANGIISQTIIAKNSILKRNLNNNVIVIPNPISKFNNNKKNFKNKVILTLGRLVESKNHIELIKIFHEINIKDWKLIIGGDGPMREVLEEYILKNDLSDNVILVGKVDDIELFFSTGSIFAFTSLSEGFPNALMEGLCYPLASIAYDCPTGVSDLIFDNVNGFLIPLQNKKMYKERLLELINSEDLRYKFMNKSMLLRDKYSQEVIVNQYFNFITS